MKVDINIKFNKIELVAYKKDEPRMKSNKRVIDENQEKLKYQTKTQEMNGTIENLRLKKLREIENLRLKKLKETTNLAGKVNEQGTEDEVFNNFIRIS